MIGFILFAVLLIVGCSDNPTIVDTQSQLKSTVWVQSEFIKQSETNYNFKLNKLKFLYEDSVLFEEYYYWRMNTNPTEGNGLEVWGNNLDSTYFHVNYSESTIQNEKDTLSFYLKNDTLRIPELDFYGVDSTNSEDQNQ